MKLVQGVGKYTVQIMAQKCVLHKGLNQKAKILGTFEKQIHVIRHNSSHSLIFFVKLTETLLFCTNHVKKSLTQRTITTLFNSQLRQEVEFPE